ncbi:MAG: hypothetical protein F6K03_10215 [Kamptonema sp. SIO4C4]|nr:hypothetical protein [Kamptonema sp. SIO4C4]
MIVSPSGDSPYFSHLPLLQEEKINFYTLPIPYVSDEEQQEIDEQLGLPNDYADEGFVNMTDWLTT